MRHQPLKWFYVVCVPIGITARTLTALSQLKQSVDPSRVQTDHLLMVAFLLPALTGVFPLVIMQRLLE